MSLPLVDQHSAFKDRSKRRQGAWAWGLVLVALSLAVLLFNDGLILMLRDWEQAEYSHGYLIPAVALFMALQRFPKLERVPIRGRWLGVIATVAGVGLLLVGELATLYTVTQYAFLLTFLGIILSAIGWPAVRTLWAPILFLVFMVPLPDFLYFSLSNDLQLISSKIGVAVIRLFGISVFLEGNVIDLGIYKLQVAEACSGLRYLFPLMSFGYLCSFLYRGPIWIKIVLFLSSIPIAILMNSLRIGVIGLLVEYYGIEAAQGFLHLFEGWVVFLACLAILFVEALVLHKITRSKEPLRSAFSIETVPSKVLAIQPPPLGQQGYLACVTAVLIIGAIVGSLFSDRAEASPDRARLASFPLSIGGWLGREEGISRDIIESLKLSDYFNANYATGADPIPVNLYIAYYGSQRKGASIHSPSSCIPGGGWEIESLSTVTVKLGYPKIGGLPVNRVVISKGGSRQLVYYWFQQRGRIITNEYLAKWYILVDAITRNRTDGALVRLVTQIRPEDDAASADRALQAFMREMTPNLGAFIPE